MTTQPAKDVQIAAWPDRRFSFLTLGICVAICILLAYAGPRLHRGQGDASPGEFDAVLWTIALTFGPLFGFIPIYTRVRSWQKLKEDRIYRWQAKTMKWGVLLVCILTVLDFGFITIFADYAQEIPQREGRVQGPVFPCDLSLAWRSQRLFSIVTCFLILLMAAGFLGPDRQEETE